MLAEFPRRRSPARAARSASWAPRAPGRLPDHRRWPLPDRRRAAPAPLCADPAEATSGDQVVCQVLEAPSSPSERLVPASGDGEIRLTYGELTALIADAFSNLKD